MHIFYTPAIQESAILPEEEAKHCLRVLRLTVGAEVLLTDGAGFFYKAVLLQENVKHCFVEIRETISAPLPWKNKIHIAIAPTKQIERIEWFAEKATEIGINEISFLQCRFSERKELNTERVKKILISAMKQSQKTVLPVLNKIQSFKQFISQPFEGQKFIAHCHPDQKESLKTVYTPGSDALVLIGPEGDFSKEEVSEAKNMGFVPVSLGESRLRTETAALVACHTLHLIY
ncbi:MAG: 16S rRNA (uracil(1498)-N(3))-methyltransferase [Dysgonamonadaceae bacterium]|jgi:16S rRNA (uracil1498-N3)-methyltransferase|nr:16S rRNA (uracil(1498)-N(3))-methyltransferase [Dysgonamonadaceae bacterium]